VDANDFDVMGDSFTADKEFEQQIKNAGAEDIKGSNTGSSITLYYIKKGGRTYHSSKECPELDGKETLTITAEEAARQVMIPCGKCVER